MENQMTFLEKVNLLVKAGYSYTKGNYTKKYFGELDWYWSINPDMDMAVLKDQHGRVRDEFPVDWSKFH
jgi:hypothetical protein